MQARKNAEVRLAKQVTVRAYIDGWSRERVVDAIVSQTGLSRLEAHRIAHGWTREQVAFGLAELYRRDGLMAPPLRTSEINRWERGHHVPNAERQDYLSRLYRTRGDRLGWGRDYATPPNMLKIALDDIHGTWTPNGNGGGELVLKLGEG